MAENLLLVFLRDRDVPCPACAYNLRNLTTNHCPECGHAMALGVRMAGRGLKAWIALLILTCLAAGTGLFWILAIAIVSLQRGLAGAVHRFLWSQPATGLAVIAFWIALPSVAGVLIVRRRFVRLPPAAQRLIVVAAIVYVTTAYGLVAWGILDGR